MGMVSILPKPRENLCLKSENYTVLQKNGLEKRDTAAILSGTSKRKGFKTS